MAFITIGIVACLTNGGHPAELNRGKTVILQVVGRPDLETLHTFVGRLEQHCKRRYRTIVKLGIRGSDALKHP